MICDPGNHWHKDDMLDEPDIPGVTSPYWGEEEDGYDESYYPGDGVVDEDRDDLPF